MKRVRDAFRSAPSSVRRAGMAAAVQAAAALLGAVLGVLAPSEPKPASAPPSWTLFIGLLLLLPLLLLPVTLARSRYPLRRYREALIFQVVLGFVCLDSLVSSLSLWAAIFLVSVVAVMAFLLTPSARAYIAHSEGRFKATETAG